MIFVSSTIGLFGVKGRGTGEGILSFGWWIGTTGLVMAFICAISLTILSFYILPNSNQSK